MPTHKTPSRKTRREGRLDVVHAASERPAFPVVGVGASTGGLDALRPRLAHIPHDSGLAAPLAEVVALLRATTGVDFGEYKPATLKRRLARRMAVRNVKDIASYLAVLKNDLAEVYSLYSDLLIRVTSFFRDKESFDDLAAIAFPEILKHKPPGAPFRAWVVGCATGEEVYSLAISLIEHFGGGPHTHPVLIFGSDLSEKAIEQARRGLYTDAAVRGLGEERLKRFFVRTERGWRVSQAVRELCVFVRHDVARDPPLTRLDLVSCRNVLVYFGQALQRRVLEAAHYCLNQPGYLLLGRSEVASGVPTWFAQARKGSRLFLRKPGPSAFRFAPRAGALPFAGPPPAAVGLPGIRPQGRIAQLDPARSGLGEHGRRADALASVNEELISGNEELQSLNEELEAAKDEIQATNERLTTSNDELQREVTSAQWARDYARSIVEAVQVPLVVLDAGLCVLSANAAYYRLFQEKPADTEGHGFFDLGAGEWDTAELHRAVAALVRAGGRFQALELERELSGVGRRATSVSGCAVLSPASESMILLAIEDVTDRQQGERHRAELLATAEEAQKRAERADRAKDLFLANLSHELRSPLSAILLHAQALQTSRLDTGCIKRAGASIEASTMRQVRLVEDLLDVSRIVAGKLSLAVEEVDWPTLVLEVLDAVEPVAEAKSVELAVELEEKPTLFLGDPGRLRQVVANLLSNAVKFTPGGGRVSVRNDTVDGFARLIVTDTGLGIDPEFLPHVFDRFSQEEGHTSYNPGLGLGLAIVRHLVELHGGTVRAESPGKDLGATFTVALPRRVALGADVATVPPGDRRDASPSPPPSN